MAAPRDYYQTLGVSETATTDEIKKAFRRLAKQHHPDRNPNNPQAVERFKEVNEAHDVLSDPAKRKKYDEMRRYGAFAGAGAGWGAGRPGPGSGGGVDFDASDGSFGGLGDLFSSIFGRRGEGRGGEPDDEVETTVTIPFRVAALGGKVPIVLGLTEVCPMCSGSGAAPGAIDFDLPRVPRSRDRFVRPGRVRGEPAVPGMSREGKGPVRAVPDLPRIGGRARREAPGDYGAARDRGRRAHALEGRRRTGARGHRGGVSSRARSVFQA